MEQKQIVIEEVGPRDGVQNVKGDFIPTEKKLDMIDRMIAAGIRHMEYTSFVHPKVIPQLADAAKVTEYVLSRYPDMDFVALVPNVKGAENAYALGLRKVCNVISFSETHNMASIHRTHAQCLAAFREMGERFPDMTRTMGISTAFGCPFEGKGGKYQDPAALIAFTEPYYEAGMRHLTLCDTVGIADPFQVRRVITALQTAFPDVVLQMHLHDTRGLGMANLLMSLECGVRHFQTALSGLGGSPVSPGAPGNLSTEDTVWMLSEMGYETGIDFPKLLAAAKYQARLLPQVSCSGHHILID